MHRKSIAFLIASISSRVNFELWFFFLRRIFSKKKKSPIHHMLNLIDIYYIILRTWYVINLSRTFKKFNLISYYTRSIYNKLIIHHCMCRSNLNWSVTKTIWIETGIIQCVQEGFFKNSNEIFFLKNRY